MKDKIFLILSLKDEAHLVLQGELCVGWQLPQQSQPRLQPIPAIPLAMGSKLNVSQA